jgi:uncharacterized protein
MKWRPRKGGSDVEDRRGQGGAGFPGGGGGGMGLPIPMPGGRAGGGIGTIIIAIVLFLLIRGCGGGDDGGFNVPGLPADPTQVPEQDTGSETPEGAPQNDKQAQFAEFVVGDAQDFWSQQLQASGNQFDRANLVLFTSAVNSGCGQASAATGPFYCPLDQKAYVDLSFFEELNRRFKAPGDFAQAYVLAHEIGHHVQQELGIEQKVRDQSQTNPDDANELSIRLELQADCFAGLWGRSAYDRGALEDGDLEEGIAAAEAVGDDRIQEQTQGRIDPESWTHGSSEQRIKWFRAGFDSGDIKACDTFAADEV